MRRSSWISVFSIKDLSLYRDARTLVIFHAVVQNFVTAYTNTNNN